ncbi:outer membrane protein [Loktanella salsilacus]|uniref:outer membrane protein n=1 Tax=Loktanella salsilacus TaxID=195913 RepID=UPI0037361E85
MKSPFFLSAIVGLSFAVTANAGSLIPLAQEVAVGAPAPMIIADTGNDWTGGYAGASLGYATGDAKSANASGDLAGNGGTLFAGYQLDFGTFVLGGELEYLLGGVSDDEGSFEFDNAVRGKVRLGYDVGQTLVYGMLGASYVNASFADRDIEAAGYLFGAGVDYRVSPAITVGGEIIADRFDDFNENTADEANVNTVSLRVAYSF